MCWNHCVLFLGLVTNDKFSCPVWWCVQVAMVLTWVLIWSSCGFRWCSSLEGPLPWASTWSQTGCGSCAVCYHNASSPKRLKFDHSVVPPPGTTPHCQSIGYCPWISENVTRCIWGNIFQGKHNSLQLLPLCRILFATHSFKQFSLRLPSGSGLLHPTSLYLSW